MNGLRAVSFPRKSVGRTTRERASDWLAALHITRLFTQCVAFFFAVCLVDLRAKKKTARSLI